MYSCFCSWSGGKDCCLALYKAINLGYIPRFLLTMCIETGDRSRSHGLSSDVLKAQAVALEIPLLLQSTSWKKYQMNFIDKLHQIKRLDGSITTGIFGDIDIQSNGQWEKNVCAKARLKALLPLWKMNRKIILKEFLSVGFKAFIVSVKQGKLSPDFLAREIDHSLIKNFERLGIDPCGEHGEYHSVVTDGPLFNHPIRLKKQGTPVLYSSYWFQDFSI